MSGVALIFRRDGAPAARGDLEAMTDAMAHRAVDGVQHELDGPVGVGFCSMVTTPEAGRERQPLRCRGGSTIVAMDGRLDDRQTLRARLGGRIAPDVGDGGLLALAVERWGAGFVNRIIGDFAVVVADGAGRRVVCARDHLGVKPLYYASIGPLFVAASEVGAVLAHPGVPDDLDPAAFQVWAEQWVVPEGTIYRSISTLPMGSTVVVTQNGVLGPSRFWDPSTEPDRARAPDDLVEEYRNLVDEATRDRLRAAGPVAVAMSGGLDSTAVASTALALARQDPAVPEIRLSSLVFPGHRRADESDLITVMERSLGVTVRRVRPRPRGPAELEAEIEQYRDLPDVPNDMLGATVRPDLGERVLLTGLGGDDWFYAPRGLHLARLVRRGRLVAAVHTARAGKLDGRDDKAGAALWRFGFRPLPKVPGAVLGRSPFLSKAITRCGGALGRRFLDASWCPSGVPLDTASVLSTSRNPLLASRLAIIERQGAHHGFELRHPLHDLRLVDLSLRLPGGLRIVGGDPRWLPRQAMQSLVPDEIRLRRDKAEFSVIVREELELADSRGLLTTTARTSWEKVRATEPDIWHPDLTRLWSSAVAGIWEDAVGRGFRPLPSERLLVSRMAIEEAQ